MSQAQGHIGENIETIVLFGILALFLNMAARSKGFFTLPASSPFSKLQVSGRQVASCFGIYLAYSLLLAPLITHLCKLFYTDIDIPVALISWVQFSTISLIIVTLFAYAKRQDRSLIKKIWKNYSLPTPSSPLADWVIGALTWILGFPVVVVVGELCDTLIYLLFGMQPYEQVAVRYLKMTLDSPSMLIIALFTILLAAPVIEEFLFRGMLQTWLKKKMGTKAAILIASLFFALFHLAASQGLGNISLALSLFSFACFLGFIYEKKGSLFASIGLHMTFNAVSTFRILFFSEP